MIVRFITFILLIATIYYLFKKGKRLLVDLASTQERLRKQQQESPGSKEKQDPYQILGVSKDASPEEIVRAYRILAQQYHPDKVAHLGADLQHFAHERFTKIQQAYDWLKQRHNGL